jgi:two-component system phosphate regulon sensor histidine kinase PhoR
MRYEGDRSKDIESAYIESTLLGIQELKKNLVTQIAHNFRTPLTSVIGFAEMLLEDRPLTDEQRVEYARFIQYEGIRLSKLIDDVLELSTLEGGNSQLRIRDCVLQEVVAKAICQVADFAQSRLVTVKRCFASSPVMIRLDPQKIGQAMYQLLHNAIRFTKPNDEIAITIATIDKSAEIAIRDGGPGMPEEEIRRIFRKDNLVYRPEDDSRSTGVGLSIVKHIVDLHNGEILVQSNNGEGSVFTMRLPGILE